MRITNVTLDHRQCSN